MSETWRVETWQEEEQEDSCSSCSWYLLLESSDDTEIVTIGEDCVPSVPGVPSEVDRLFLWERILGSYQLALEHLRLNQEDGGSPGSVPHDTDADQAQDTDTDQDQDTDVAQTKDTPDTQDTQATH